MIHTLVQSKAAATTLTMPTLRKRSRREIVENPPQSEIEIPMKDHKNKKSEYELTREERIRENRERMGKFGLFDISLSLKPNPPSRPTTSKNPKSPVSLNPSQRSTRLQNVAPIHYTEEAINKRIYGKKKVKKTPSKLMPDSYTWWKYGRKQIKGSIRDYSECSTVNCTTKKYEDRTRDDPTVIIVTYNGERTHP